METTEDEKPKMTASEKAAMHARQLAQMHEMHSSMKSNGTPASVHAPMKAAIAAMAEHLADMSQKTDTGDTTPDDDGDMPAQRPHTPMSWLGMR